MNARAVAFASIFVIAGVTSWRLLRTSSDASATTAISRVERVWASSALALVISLATDIDAGLGAAFGSAIAISLLYAPDQPAGALTGTIQKLSRGKLLQQVPSSSSASGSAPANPAQPQYPSIGPGSGCPSGYMFVPNHGCVPVSIN